MTLAEHYDTETTENTRLVRSPHGRLEFRRTQELVRRAIPTAGQRVLDVGGATGVHARWLAADGHSVHVVDPVTASRRLPKPGASFDRVEFCSPLRSAAISRRWRPEPMVSSPNR
ncbi:class I SAM-dependent methyltransferase [Amycolatopsis nivea]